MNHLSPALSYAALLVPAPALSQGPGYLPSAIEHVTTPDFAVLAYNQSGVDLRRVRFSGPAESDLAVLRAGELGLLLRPGRLESFFQIRSNVTAIATVAAGPSDQEQLLVASPADLEVLACDPMSIDLHSPSTTTLVQNSDAWSTTRGIWVQYRFSARFKSSLGWTTTAPGSTRWSGAFPTRSGSRTPRPGKCWWPWRPIPPSTSPR